MSNNDNLTEREATNMEQLLNEVEQKLTEISAILSITRNVDQEENREEIAILMDMAEDIAKDTRVKVSCAIVDGFMFAKQAWRTTAQFTGLTRGMTTLWFFIYYKTPPFFLRVSVQKSPVFFSIGSLGDYESHW